MPYILVGMLPDWQLPAGTDRGLWDYVQSERVAREYDAVLAGTPLLQADLAFAQQHFPTCGRLIDLGCGTGRLAMHFAAQGYDCTGVDLSATMLDVLREKAEQANLTIERIQANLVELDSLPDAGFDYAACLFSTLGMIRGGSHRRQFLTHVRRLLKPQGIFVLHAHNDRYRLGFGLGKRGLERGDRTMPQVRGGADLTLHHYTARELQIDLAHAGFRIRQWVPVAAQSKEPLVRPWLIPRWRAYGFLVAAE